MKNLPSKENKNLLKIATPSKRIGNLVIEAVELQATNNGKPSGQLLFDNFTYNFRSEDRVGIIGPNGSGKSTLLDLIANRITPTGGKLLLGSTVSLGYLDQQTDELVSGEGLERKVIDCFVKWGSSLICCCFER